MPTSHSSRLHHSPVALATSLAGRLSTPRETVALAQSRSMSSQIILLLQGTLIEMHYKDQFPQPLDARRDAQKHLLNVRYMENDAQSGGEIPRVAHAPTTQESNPGDRTRWHEEDHGNKVGSREISPLRSREVAQAGAQIDESSRRKSQKYDTKCVSVGDQVVMAKYNQGIDCYEKWEHRADNGSNESPQRVSILGADGATAVRGPFHMRPLLSDGQVMRLIPGGTDRIRSPCSATHGAPALEPGRPPPPDARAAGARRVGRGAAPDAGRGPSAGGRENEDPPAAARRPATEGDLKGKRSSVIN
jgi:hypothetical protein